LIKAGILPADAKLSCTSLTGYSGGGKKMIAEYEADEIDELLGAPRQYGLGQSHKHLPEMQAVTGLVNAPLFLPIVADFYSGMEVTVPLFSSQLCEGKTVEDIKAAYAAQYQTPLLRYVSEADEGGFLSAAALSHKDSMQVSVHGNSERILLVARYDNLGKGASGAAIECLNLVLGCEPYLGLEL
jgi:N-acetyl-gamma-glutamyl-phosphate reductase